MRSPLIICLALACGRGAPKPSYGAAGPQAAFDLDADPARPGFFWDLPWPSDLRLLDGKPQLASFPNPRGLPMIETFRRMAMERGGFPVIPVGYFRFDAQVSIEASQVMLLDLEEPARIPVVLDRPARDDYVPANLLAVAPRPGFVLAPRRKHAFVVLRKGALGVPAALDQLLQGVVPDGALAAGAYIVYRTLTPALAALGIDRREVAAATVFTTGDVVAETAALSDSLKERYQAVLSPLVPGDRNERVCVLKGSVLLPQFQRGAPPFNRDGLFDDPPVRLRDERVPLTIVIPRGPMPAAGWPLAIYFHGSGGVSADVIDKGPTLTAGGLPQQGRGPGWVLAGHGIASASSAMPVNPERLPGAGETAYLNLQNLPAMRDTFRQGVIEQRMLLDALRNLPIPADCGGGHFDPDKLVAQGQSMGGMYANLVAAVEPRIRAAVPTGAGGFWTWFILITKLHDGLPDLVALLLNAARPLTFMHPALHLIETAWEPADPFVSMPRLGRRPLSGHPSRPVYEPVGKGDQYFPIELYDAVALAYGHRQAGEVVWPSMQQALRLASLDGLLPWPARQSVVVQYAGDGIEDPHAIYRQLDAVKHQYGCFFETFLATGTAVVPAPAAPCSR